MIVERRGISFEVEEHPHWEKATWEDYTYRWLEQLLTSDSDFIDIGAWIGSFSLWGARLSRRVLAIEPDPIAHAMLMRSIDLENNQAWNIAAPKDLAIWSNVGERELYSGPGDLWGKSTSTLRQPQGKRMVVRVSTVRLATLPEMFDLSERSIVVKMDTEGAEGAILSGSLDWIKEVKPSLLVAPHDRLYADYRLRSVVPQLVAAYAHAVDEKGELLEWPEGPEPRMMIFTDADLE